jgi:glycosyltransferase involved in cell wall biosynthesis
MAAVCFNGQFFCHRLKTGVQRFALEALKALDELAARDDRAAELIVLVPPDAAPDVAFTRIRIESCGRRTGYAWEQIDLPIAAGRRLLINPCNSGPLLKRRQITVMHDAVVLDHPEWFDPAYVKHNRRVMPWLCRMSRLILTVSSFSRDRIVASTGVAREKVRVAHNGVSAAFSPPAPDAVARMRTSLDLSRPYVLTVGSIEPRKNQARLLEAWRTIAGTFPDHDLVIVGGRDSIFAAAEFAALPASVRMTGYIDDSLLPALYGAAAAFVYPSIYEGFGLPPVEALACGALVMTSAGTAMEEICGEAALYFDPHDAQSIARMIGDALAAPGRFAATREAGRPRAARYTWQRTAEGLLDAIAAVDRPARVATAAARP